MAIPKRQHLPGTYFITSITHNRRRLFQVDRTAQLFLETLQHYRHEGHYKPGSPTNSVRWGGSYTPS